MRNPREKGGVRDAFRGNFDLRFRFDNRPMLGTPAFILINAGD